MSYKTLNVLLQFRFYYNLCDLEWGDLAYQLTGPINHVIMWYWEKAVFPPPLGQWPPTLARIWRRLSWLQPSSQVARILYYHLMFESFTSVSQRQWSSDMVGLCIRVKRPHSLVDHMACNFQKTLYVHFHKVTEVSQKYQT